MKRGLLLLIGAVFIANSALAWGPKGHDIIAYIAECNLTKKTHKKVTKALGNKSLVYYSSWMDNIRNMPEYAHTSTWHYANIDEGQTYESMEKNPKGDIVGALQIVIEKLKSGKLSPQEEDIYLRYLIHLMGDLHCPMHTARLSDLGGNQVPVKWFGSQTNLHKLWDSQLIESVRKWSYMEWREQIDRCSKSERVAITVGDVYDWFIESHAISKRIYEGTPQGSNQSWDYMFEWYPTVEEQMRRGGYRLAYILNNIYK